MVEPYYQDDLVTLYHGDCREVTQWLLADVLVTDPPYGMDLRSGRKGEHGDLAITGDQDLALRDGVIERWGGRPALVFGRWSLPAPANSKAMLVWDKGEHTGMGDLSLPWKPDYEVIFVRGKGFTGRRGSSILRHLAPSPAKSQGRLHPTEKPLSVLTTLLAKCPSGVIADPFAGSGSTLVAAKLLGRSSIGVEIEERYCEIAARRLAQDALPFEQASAGSSGEVQG